jgi:hypothetical protein
MMRTVYRDHGVSCTIAEAILKVGYRTPIGSTHCVGASAHVLNGLLLTLTCRHAAKLETDNLEVRELP